MVDNLWKDDVRAAWLSDQAPAPYRNAILDESKLSVEMPIESASDEFSPITCFLTLNTASFTVIGVPWDNLSNASARWLLFPLLLGLGESAAWFSTPQTYRQFNSARYEVIGELEARLPASPYWGAQWDKLGKGKDWKRYWPPTHVEMYVEAKSGGR